jgi:hypothetical protein
MALQGYQIGASALIILFARKYKDSVCEVHRHAVGQAPMPIDT